MLQKDLIQEFLGKKRIAVVGVSRKGDLPANYIFKKFKKGGYSVYPINPNANEVEGEKCYPDIYSLPEIPEAILMAGTPEVSEKCMEDCVKNKIPIVWMHRGIGKGSYSVKAEENAKRNGIKVISNGCPMMFISKVDGFHKFLSWIK